MQPMSKTKQFKEELKESSQLTRQKTNGVAIEKMGKGGRGHWSAERKVGFGGVKREDAIGRGSLPLDRLTWYALVDECASAQRYDSQEEPSEDST